MTAIATTIAITIVIMVEVARVTVGMDAAVLTLVAVADLAIPKSRSPLRSHLDWLLQPQGRQEKRKKPPHMRELQVKPRRR